MRGSVLLAVLSGVLFSSSSSWAWPRVLEAIDEAHRAGAIGEGERLLQRVAAVRKPELLPARLRQLAAEDGARARCHSEVLVEAFQRLGQLAPAEAEPLAKLLSPPSDLTYFVEAAGPFPVRVSFADPALEEKALRILDAVATSYQREVVEMGFWAPLVEPGSEPYRFYLMDASGAAGYTSPYLENLSTPHSDAYTYIVIDPSLDDLLLDATVAHEFNHACQVAMDASEVRSFMENSASYIELPVFPASAPYTYVMFPYFQGRPYRALEYYASSQSDGYEYGGALWPLFLVLSYGDGDPAWLRQVWEGSVQDGWINEPDYFDALDGLLAADGGLRAATKRFARDRFFVGSYADGNHLPGAEQWGDAEVAISASWTSSSLPIVDAAPGDPATRPQPNGCNYIVMNPDPASNHPIRFSFDGDAAVAWDVAVLELASAGATEQSIALDTEAKGSVAVEPSGDDPLLLLICQVSDADYDPDHKAWKAGDYRYGIAYDLPQPTVEAVAPATVELGAHDVELVISGSGFVAGPELGVSVGGGGVAVALEEVVSATELRVRVTVAPTAEPGPRDLTVHNPGGSSATLAQALLLRAPEAAAEVEPEDDAGCGCRLQGSSPRAGSPFWLFAPALLALRRRPRRGTTAALLGLLATLWVLAQPAVAVAGPPPPSDGYVESATYPLRVYYTAAAGEEIALVALGFAEDAWLAQVEQMGFMPPSTEDAEGNVVPGLWIYLDPDSPYDHAEPIGDNPNTSWTDCTTRAVIASLSPLSYLEVVVGHEMNHAMEMAQDCGESDFAWENTTMAVTALMAPEDSLYAGYFLPTFQAYPHHGLDCAFWADQKRAYYHYGASLFQLFVEDRYGAYDGKLLAQLWQETRQDGSVTVGAYGVQMSVPNDPNLMEAMDSVLPDGFAQAYVEFARWRYFVGLRDDGQHFSYGALWSGAELALDSEIGLDALPRIDAAPLFEPNDFGAVYVELSLEGLGADEGVGLRFRGDAAVSWSVEALLLRHDGDSEVRSVTVDPSGSGELVLDGLEEVARAVLVFANLSAGDHDADAPICSFGAPFRYDLERVDLAVAPTLSAVDPSELSRGQSHYVWISGTDFAEGLTVSVSGGGIEVGVPTVVDATSVGVELTVSDNADPGARDLLVTNPNGLGATLAGGVTVVDDSATSEEVSGCGCAVPGSDPQGSPWAALLFLAAAVRAARRKLGRG